MSESDRLKWEARLEELQKDCPLVQVESRSEEKIIGRRNGEVAIQVTGKVKAVLLKQFRDNYGRAVSLKLIR